MIWLDTIVTIILFVYACLATYKCYILRDQCYILKDKCFEIPESIYVIYRSDEYERSKWLDADIKLMSKHGYTLKNVDTFLTGGRSIYIYVKDEQCCDETIKSTYED